MGYFISAALTGGAGAAVLAFTEYDFMILFGLALVGLGIVFLTMGMICLAAKLAGKPRPLSALMFAVGVAVLILAVCIYCRKNRGLFGGFLMLFAVPTLGIVFFAALSIWLSLRSKKVRRDDPEDENNREG